MQKVCAQLKTFGSASTRCFYTSQFTFPIMVFLFHALLSHGFWEVSMNCVGILILDLKTGRAWQFYSYLSSPTFSLLVYMHVSFTCFPLTIYVHFCNLQYINLPVNKELSVMFILDFPCCFILLLTFLIASWAQALNCEPPKYSTITKTAYIPKTVYCFILFISFFQYGSQWLLSNCSGASPNWDVHTLNFQDLVQIKRK